MGLEYVDIFYSHRFDPDTPLEETMGALDSAVRAGKALYAGISSYSAEQTREAAAILRELGTPLLIHQPSYSMLNRWIEPDLLDALGELGRRLHRVLAARSGDAHRQVPRRHPRGFAREPVELALAEPGHGASGREDPRARTTIAAERGQTLAQMALAWVLRDERVTSALIGASSVAQLEDNVAALDRLGFTDDELAAIDRYATDSGINIWA